MVSETDFNQANMIQQIVEGLQNELVIETLEINQQMILLLIWLMQLLVTNKLFHS